MDNVVSIIAIVFASSGFWSVMQVFLTDKFKKKDAVRSGLLAILHNTIYKEATDYINKGYISTNALSNLNALYKPYTLLGGNGTGEALIKKCRELPIKG